MTIIYQTNQISAHNQMQGYTALGAQCEEFKITVPATVGFANGDSLILCAIPLNATVLGFYLSLPALDTNVSPTLTLEIGDTVDIDRYVASTSTLGQAAADVWFNAINGYVAGSLPHTYSTQTTFASPGDITSPTGYPSLATSQNIADFLVMKFTAANATPATSGTLKGFMLYELNPNATI